MKNIIGTISIALILSGCEKVIDLKYKDNQSKIIIEGNITNQPGPYFVKISRSIGVTETGNYPAVDNALVVISDDAGNSETLTSEGNRTYKTATIIGTEGRTYSLTVQVENQTYTAQSTMPQLVPFDYIKVDSIVVTGETEYNLIPVYTDPIAKGNNYRFVLSVNSKLINQHFIQNDDIKNGVANTFRLEINDNDLKLKPGDSTCVNMQCIDKNVALFYTTLMLMGDSGPGGGTTPNNPPSNISNGALGLFSAHAEKSRNVIIP